MTPAGIARSRWLSFVAGVRSLLRRGRAERELDEELRAFHAAAAADRIERGADPTAAAREVRLEQGSVLAAREAVRGAAWEAPFETLARDLRFALRQLRRAPGFTVVAIVSLALGIGANTAIFSVVNAVLLRPLPYRDAGRLVTVWTSGLKTSELSPVSSPDYVDWKTQNRSFADIGASSDAMDSLTGAGDPVSVIAYRFSSDFFSVLGVPAMLGRTFTPEEDQIGNDHEVVLGFRLWQTRFGQDRAIVGRKITLDLKPYTVAGVMPADFDYPPGVELWTPLTTDPDIAANRDAHWLRLMARLKPGVSLASAQAEMNTIAARQAARYPATNRDEGVSLVPLRSRLAGAARPALLLLLGAVGLVLLIACANLANLLLSRAIRRRGEIAMRMVLGAGRARIVRQLATESLLVSLAAGALGIVIAVWGAHALIAMFPATIANSGLPRLESVPLDARVLAFALLVSVATGILFGLAPAWLTSSTRATESLKDLGRGETPGRAGKGFRNAVVVVETALSMMLLIAAGLMIKSFVRLARADLGFRTAHELSFRILLPDEKYAQPWQQQAFHDDVLRRVRALPGVTAAGSVTFLPLSGWWGVRRVRRAEDPILPGKDFSAPVWSAVSPDYFRATGIPLLQGRAFTAGDDATAVPVAIVSAGLARRMWPGQSALGRRIALADFAKPETVVGVVGDIHQLGLGSVAGAEKADPTQEVYVPVGQRPSGLLCFVVRTAGDPAALAPAVDRAVWAVDKEQPVSFLESMDQLAAESNLMQRASMILLALFAAIALALAAMGIYGVLAYAAATRTQEIGIRSALGAARGDLVRLVMTEGVRLAAAGIALGALGALPLTRALAGLLYGVKPADPAIFAGVPIVLAAVAALACYLPARRAARLDPATALRWE